VTAVVVESNDGDASRWVDTRSLLAVEDAEKARHPSPVGNDHRRRGAPNISSSRA